VSLTKTSLNLPLSYCFFVDQSYDGYGNAEICITTDKYMFVINCPIVINALLCIECKEHEHVKFTF